MDARIVRQIIGDGLIAVQQIARAVDAVHHFHRRLLAALGGQILWRKRERFLQVGHVFLEDRELFAFGLVADHHRRAVGSFHAEQIVEIGFVGREDHVEFRIFEIEPGDVARIIIVGKQRVRAKIQEFREGGIVAQRGGVVKVLRHGLKKFGDMRRGRELLRARRRCGGRCSTDRRGRPFAPGARRRRRRIARASILREKSRARAASAAFRRTAFDRQSDRSGCR